MHTTSGLTAEDLGGTAVGRAALATRALPFLAVAVVAEVSVLILPGPVARGDMLLSICLLGASGLCLWLPWRVMPSWVDLLVPLLFTTSALMLMLAAGRSGQGMGLGFLVLLPVAWAALYLQPWKSVVVLGAAVATELLAELSPVAAGVSDPVRLGRVVFWFVIGGLVAYSIGELRRRQARIAAQRDTLISQREKSFEEFALSVARLERRNREGALLNDLADMLHRCLTKSEAYEVIGHSAEKLFPEGGSLSVYNKARDTLGTKAAWGTAAPDEHVFSPLDCRAMRHGRAVESSPEVSPCVHLRGDRAGRSICLPLVAHGESLGVLNLVLPPAADNDSLSALVDDHRSQLARTASEQIALLLGDFYARDELRSLSIRDPLTNLYNRRFMEDTLTRVLQRTEGSSYEVSIVSIDVDHFKNFNDLYGHEVGDAVLRALGDILLTQFRDSDVPCRSGGEEFTLILPHSSLADAQVRVTELQRLMAGLRIAVGGRAAAPPLPLTLSFGIATFPAHGASADVLLRASDRALYGAKAAGRNRVVLAGSSR